MPASNTFPVLIAGAGPTGLLLALWLSHFGVPHRIVDPAISTGQTSRAIVVHARILEFYQQLGIAEKAISLGEPIDKLVVNFNGVARNGIKFREAGKGQSRYPFVLSLAQDQHEAMLESELKARGGKVERGVEVSTLKQHDDHVAVTLHTLDNSKPDEIVKVSYIAGCDGAHSVVRQPSGIKMEGGTYQHRFFVVDVEARGDILNAGPNLNICLSGADFIVAIRMAGTHRARLIGFVPDSLRDSEDISYSDCAPAVDRNMGSSFEVEKVNWFSHYKVHHRSASHFRKGRVFLLGDAAHLHSPVGGQGMNTGLGDATNLAWKFAQVYHSAQKSAATTSNAADLLDSYQAERLPFALNLVSTTDNAFSVLTSDSYLSHFLRRIFTPYIMPLFTSWLPIAPMMYRRVSQLGIEYRQSSLSEKVGTIKGRVRAGDRLPWVEGIALMQRERQEGEQQQTDNFAVLQSLSWQAHMYVEVQAACEWAERVLAARKITLHAFKWNKRCGEVGLERGEFYLVRPDGYIGLIVGACSKDERRTEGLERYLVKWDVRGAPGA